MTIKLNIYINQTHTERTEKDRDNYAWSPCDFGVRTLHSTLPFTRKSFVKIWNFKTITSSLVEHLSTWVQSHGISGLAQTGAREALHAQTAQINN